MIETSSLTTGPASTIEFHLRPYSRRLIFVVAVAPTLHAAHTLDRRRRPFHGQHDFLCRSANRQIADQFERAGAAGLDALRLEGDGRVIGGIEEVVAAQMAVALRVLRRDPVDVDPDVGFHRAHVLAVVLDRAGDRAELAADGRHHHVPHAEIGGGVRGIDGPLVRSELRFCRRRLGRRRLGVDVGKRDSRDEEREQEPFHRMTSVVVDVVRVRCHSAGLEVGRAFPARGFSCRGVVRRVTRGWPFEWGKT